ncbi:hypothetical protein LJK87_32855 [Paenibacillus sp. P25]|nr:hypothetical protein LJK87_32855 [Paenibacillus sp. P25]
MLFDLVYFFFTYFLFLGGVAVSHFLFITGLLGWIKVTVPGPFMLVWFLAYVLFVVEIMITLGIERTELHLKNVAVILLMYLSYSQLWLVLVVRAFGLHIKSVVSRQEVKWDKTQRFQV